MTATPPLRNHIQRVDTEGCSRIRATLPSCVSIDGEHSGEWTDAPAGRYGEMTGKARDQPQLTQADRGRPFTATGDRPGAGALPARTAASASIDAWVDE